VTVPDAPVDVTPALDTNAPGIYVDGLLVAALDASGAIIEATP
jgi:hypothetical protein